MYKLKLSALAESDLENLSDTIMYKYSAPKTAEKYMRELYEKMAELMFHPEIYAIQTRPCFRKYGDNVRRLNYKKMAVIYIIHGETVYIHRIVPAATITGI